MEFIRRGTPDPQDFVDRLIKRRFVHGEGSPELPTNQDRLKGIFEPYWRAGQLSPLFLIDGTEIETTPILLREYEVEAGVYDIGVGVGRKAPKSEDDQSISELSIVITIGNDVDLVVVPENGVESVPATHGMPGFLDWLEGLYPSVFPVKPKP